MKLVFATLTLVSVTICNAHLPDVEIPRNIQEVMLNIGNSARYGPYVSNYSRRPLFGKGHSKDVSSSPRALEEYLLPTNVIPLSYDIRLIPYLTNPSEKMFTFDGESTIRVRVLQSTSSIVMHAWDLSITQIGVVRIRDGAAIPVSDYTLAVNDTQFFTINTMESLEAGQEYDVFVFFNGILNDEGYGFFRSMWTDGSGNTRWLAATQFESTAARRAFPCFDQPDMKATFTIHIAQEPNYKALSNMPIASEGDPVEGAPSWTWAHFQPSVPMSTYLVAFTTSEFLSVTDGFYSIWARPEVYQTGDYALQFSPQLVAYYENYTGHKYSLPKMDQFGMTDFFSGAMENWGLITYLDPYLLYDPLEDDCLWLQLISQLLAHEIAHQWFGNLVSPVWWSDLWINEGFATYYEYHSIEGVNPDWQMKEQFVVDNMHYVFRTDDDFSNPIYRPTIDSPASTDSMFDSITYSKGGCIVRFMIHFMGENNFRQGINEYLTAKGFAAASQYDLFNHLTPHAPANMPVTFTELMDSWTVQAGYPILTVARNYANQSVTIIQQRYGYAGPEKWIIPLTMTRGDSPDFMSQQTKAWLMPEDSFLYLTSNLVPGPTDWFMINLQQTGYYRVNYDTGNWRLITDAMTINASIFHELNRAQLMDDAHELAIHELLDYDTALHTTNYLAQETRLTPWTVATYALEYIRDRMYQDITRVQLFNSYMQERILTVYNSVNGFNQLPTDPLGMITTRRLITRWACNTRLLQCNTDGNVLYTIWRNSANPDVDNNIALELRTPTYCAGQRTNGMDARTFLLERYTAATNQDERDRLLSAMGCTGDTALLQSYLDLSLTPAIFPGDALSVFIAVHSHPEGVQLALDFLLLNWQQLDTLYGNVGYGFTTIADKLNTQEQYDAIVQFQSDHQNDLGPVTHNLINVAKATLSDILIWNEKNLATVTNYFNNA